MRITFKSGIFIMACALLAGCSGMRSDLVLDTAGPMPGQGASVGSGSGTLIVYSAGKVNADFNSRDPDSHEFSDYRILNSDKKLLEHVHNVANELSQGPVSVNLPPGKYFVVARSNGYGVVTVPVIIASGQQTLLHLDGQWPNESSFDQNNAVRLPDGEIVGWKSASGF